MNAVANRSGSEVLPVRALRWMRAAGAIAASVGVLVLAGWMFEIAILMSVIPGLVAMKPNAAVGFLAVGVAFLLAAEGDRDGVRRAARNVLAGFAIVLGLVTVSQTWFGVDFGIDQLLFRDSRATGAPPGRMAQPTSVGFALAGLAVLLFHAAPRIRHLLSLLTAALGGFAWLTVIAYFYNVTAVTTPSSHVPMALHTSATLAIVMAVCAVVLARDGWGEILLADSEAAVVARRLVPIALLLPIVLGWLRFLSERFGWLEHQMAVAVFALLNVIVLVFLVIGFARRLHSHAEARLRVERELERTSARLSAVVDSVGHAVFVIGSDRRVELFSRTAEKMVGIPGAEALGRDAASFHESGDEEPARRWYEQAIGEGAETVREWRWVRPQGESFDVEVKLSPVRNHGANAWGFVGVASDITLRKEAERVVTDARRVAEHANLQKTRFLANMSHELRTPLNGIIGFSYLLRQTGAASFTPDQLRHVSVIESSARHLPQLINDILDLSKVETGKMTPNLEPVEPAGIVEECRMLLSATAAEKNVSLEVDVARDVPAILLDAKMMKQILVNLLGNAVKFTPPGGRVMVSVARYGTERMVFRVADTGIGIDPADQARIFDAFQQVDSAYSRDQQGTGLGLTLTRRLVELQGGTIRVESAGEGKGSVFVVELPVATPPPVQAFDEAAFSIASSGPLVLVAEDDPPTREILGRALAAGRYSVAFAGDTDDLIRKARELSPRAITLDILMPPKNGWEALSRLKSNVLTCDIPVVIVSVVEDRVLAFSLGAADYLVKPVDAEHLRKTIARVLEEQPRIPRRVLVVDDDPAVRELLSGDLLEMGYEVETAPDGEIALEAIGRACPDLAIIDLVMPRMNGLQLVRHLRESGGDAAALPVIIYTSSGAGEETSWLEAMVEAVVPKSSHTTLLEEIGRITGGSGAAGADH